ncbi:MAG: MerR family transcriptional regulator [Myxococcota bacterium]
MEREQGASTTRAVREAKRPSAARSGRKREAPLDEAEARRQLAASKKLYYRIGEVSELTGVKAHVLRYWETEFRWMAPPKSRSKQRLYRKRDIEFVWLLKRLLWDQRYTIAGARQRIQELGLDEALNRCAEGESLDDVLAATRSGAGESRPDASASSIAPGSAAPTTAGDGAATDLRERIDWVGLRGALESMQSELHALRGALQQGL